MQIKMVVKVYNENDIFKIYILCSKCIYAKTLTKESTFMLVNVLCAGTHTALVLCDETF